MTNPTALDGLAADMLSGTGIAARPTPPSPPPQAGVAATSDTDEQPQPARKKRASKKPAGANRPAAKRTSPARKPAAAKKTGCKPAPAAGLPVVEGPEAEPLPADAHVDDVYDAAILSAGRPDASDRAPDFDEDGIEFAADAVDAEHPNLSDDAIASWWGASSQHWPGAATADSGIPEALFIPDAPGRAPERKSFTPPVPGRAGAAMGTSPWSDGGQDPGIPDPPARLAPEPPKHDRGKRAISLPRISRGRLAAFGTLALISAGLLAGTPTKPPAPSTSTPARPIPVATPTPTGIPTATATPARRSPITSSTKRERRSSTHKRERVRTRRRTVYVPAPATAPAAAAPRTTTPAPVAPRSASAPSAGQSSFWSEFRP